MKLFVTFFLLLSALMIPAVALARPEKIPHLAVEQSCHAAESYGMTEPQQTYKNCMLDENEAKQQLQKKWSTYKVSTRRSCIAAGATPSPSYVELLTCIEMTDEILEPVTGGGGGAAVGHVPGGARGGSPPPMPQLAPGPRAMPR